MLTESYNFLGLEPSRSNPATAKYIVLPIPYEGAVSWATGTIDGPQAILEASTHVEWFDERQLYDFTRPGIATLAPLIPAGEGADPVLQIEQAAWPIIQTGQFLLALGGDHSITVGLVQACAAHHERLSVLQIDAHADLRDSYNGSALSHACVMRRVLEITPDICQVGIRSFSEAEYVDCPALLDRIITPQDVQTDATWLDEVIRRLGDHVYITVDMDAFDPSIAPGVGTPEPGGLSWHQVDALVRRVCDERKVVAADIVETRPVALSCVTEFVAARLACKIIAYTQRTAVSSRKWPRRRGLPDNDYVA